MKDRRDQTVDTLERLPLDRCGCILITSELREVIVEQLRWTEIQTRPCIEAAIHNELGRDLHRYCSIRAAMLIEQDSGLRTDSWLLMRAMEELAKRVAELLDSHKSLEINTERGKNDDDDDS